MGLNHALRQRGLGGSEIAAVCNIYPYATAIDVFERKTGQAPVIDEWSVGPLVRGRLFERPVMEWYSLITNRTVMPCETMAHPERPLVIATPDGISCGAEPHDRVVLEVKNSSWRMGHLWGDPWTDAIPDFYVPQVIWEMAVTGLQAAHVVVYMGDEPRIYCVQWDPDLFDALYEVAESFWNDHVLTGIPPPPDASERYSQHLARRYPKSSMASYRIADEEVAPWVGRYRALLDAEKQLAAERLLVTNNLKAWIGEHHGIALAGERIDFKSNKDSAKTDWKALAIHAMQRLAQFESPDESDLASNTDSLIQQFTTVSPGNRPLCARFKKGA